MSRSVIRLDQVLDGHNISLRPQEFKELVISVAQQIAPAWTDERITCNPRVALALCEEVRRRVECPELLDEVILRALTNVRRVVA